MGSEEKKKRRSPLSGGRRKCSPCAAVRQRRKQADGGQRVGKGMRLHYIEVGREVRGMAALELGVVKLMAKHTTALLEGLVGMIRGPANPKSGSARRMVHSQPQPCHGLECTQRSALSKSCALACTQHLHALGTHCTRLATHLLKSTRT
jgi:hypothetical protein